MNHSKALRAVISVLILAGAANAVAQTTLDKTYVTGTRPTSEPPVPIFQPGGGGGGYGGVSSTTTQEQNPVPPEGCRAFLAEKPADCPNPIPFPEGATYGRDRFRGGSAMAQAIAFATNTTNGYDVTAKSMITQALSDQTRDIGAWYNPLSLINSRLQTAITNACNLQKQNLDAHPPFVGRPTAGERACASVLDSVVDENGDAGFIPWFLNWLSVQRIDIGDLTGVINLPQTVMNLLDPQNTLTQKFDFVTKDAQCASWWAWQETYQCTP